MKQLLAQNPALAAFNLPARVIVDIARRLDVPADHPLILNLPELPPLESSGIENFTCPDDWRHLLADMKPSLHRFNITSSGARYYLTDRSQNLILHVGPDKIPKWMAQLPINEHGGLFESPTLDDLGRTIQLLMARYLRRFAGMSLRQLVNRNGQLACSRTHFDILIQTRQMDIRIRRAGLDIDPGWVAWLARVVQFHYDDGDQIDV